MSSYHRLKAELATLNLQIDMALAREKAAAIREIQAKIEEWCIPLRDLQQAPGGRQSRVRTAGTREPKYRDPSSRATWSGRERAPGWLAGEDGTAFEIASPAS
jgi:DNA-binding protein H-NS